MSMKMVILSEGRSGYLPGRGLGQERSEQHLVQWEGYRGRHRFLFGYEMLGQQVASDHVMEGY